MKLATFSSFALSVNLAGFCIVLHRLDQNRPKRSNHQNQNVATNCQPLLQLELSCLVSPEFTVVGLVQVSFHGYHTSKFSEYKYELHKLASSCPPVRSKCCTGLSSEFNW